MQPSNDHMEHIERTTQGMMKACEDASGMARDHMDAAMKAAAVVNKGLEEIARNASSLIQESMTRGIDASKNMMSAKSIPEAMNSHSEFLKDCFDQWISGAGKISEVAARTAQDAMGPIAENTNNAINKIAQKAKAA